MRDSRQHADSRVSRLANPGEDPPPYEPLVPPDPERDRGDDDIPDTPGTEPPPVPIEDPLPEGAPAGPMIAQG